mmetsp:Transcript_55467/g.81551  ORF Transcript_55467/g.81551 Transcript_55467/m.81551 type:complete len:200 (+) Transcript_55467:439-1038(+)
MKICRRGCQMTSRPRAKRTRNQKRTRKIPKRTRNRKRTKNPRRTKSRRRTRKKKKIKRGQTLTLRSQQQKQAHQCRPAPNSTCKPKSQNWHSLQKSRWQLSRRLPPEMRLLVPVPANSQAVCSVSCLLATSLRFHRTWCPLPKDGALGALREHQGRPRCRKSRPPATASANQNTIKQNTTQHNITKGETSILLHKWNIA